VAAYKDHLFGEATLQNLPLDTEGPRFVINATNVQSGALWRFSRPYMADYLVGMVKNPDIPLALAVGASSAFPPVLSPARLHLHHSDFEPDPQCPLQKEPFTTEVILSHGGVYDNMGLETAWKNYQTILVSILDDQMNNTSLILLFKYRKKTLLFPGDAQIENWNHCLHDADDGAINRKLSAQTDLYKVGHHGSRNATPKTLWSLFAKKGDSDGPLQSMMSTRAGKHGDPKGNTEVPRKTLVEELDARSHLFNTQKIPGTQMFYKEAIVQ